MNQFCIILSVYAEVSQKTTRFSVNSLHLCVSLPLERNYLENKQEFTIELIWCSSNSLGFFKPDLLVELKAEMKFKRKAVSPVRCGEKHKSRYFERNESERIFCSAFLLLI